MSVLPNILEQDDSFISDALRVSDTCLYDYSNTIILKTTVNYITSTKNLMILLLRFKSNSKVFLEIYVKSSV